MTQDFGEAVAKFSGEVGDAVSRARRAAAEARELTARFREQIACESSVPDEPGTPPVPQSSDEEADFSQEQIMRKP